MQINQDFNLQAYMIRACDSQGVTISHPLGNTGTSAPGTTPTPELETLTTSSIIMPQRLLRDWAPATAAALDASHFQTLVALNVEVVLLGTGSSQQFPPGELTGQLTAQGIGIEVMHNAAACRTYNILMTEGRRVAAALLIGA
jgi:uncharacterized protein